MDMKFRAKARRNAKKKFISSKLYKAAKQNQAVYSAGKIYAEPVE